MTDREARMVQERNEVMNLNAKQAQMIAQRDMRIRELEKQIKALGGE